jgi:cyanophycinase
LIGDPHKTRIAALARWSRLLTSRAPSIPGLLSVALALTAVAGRAADPPYKYYLTGDATDVQTATKAGFALIGGGKDPDPAFRWFLERAGGGDVVVIRSSGSDGYNPYMMGLAHPNSVESIVIASPEAARDPFVAERILHAEALFIAGGDQWNYIRLWNHTPVGQAIQTLIDKGVPVGGTSAGLAVLGEYFFSAEHDSVTSPQALANPYDERVQIGSGFLHIPALGGIITDSHFHSRDRMGRTLVFLSRMREDGRMAEARAIAIDERTAALTEKDGRVAVTGEGNVYFVRTRNEAEVCRPGRPLTARGVEVYRVPSGGDFDLKAWTGHGGTAYTLDVENGVVRSSQPGGSIY